MGESRFSVAQAPQTPPAPQQAGPRLSLKVVAGPAAGQTIVVGDQPVILGRGAEFPANLGGDPELSREHARVSRFEGDRLLIEDLGSTNGTFVNGGNVAGPTVLEDGDAIWLGTSTLLVQREGAPLPEVPPVEPPTPSAEAGFLSRIADAADRNPKRILIFLGIFFLFAVAFGGPVTQQLRDERGFDDPSSESVEAEEIMAEEGDVTPGPRTAVLVSPGETIKGNREVQQLVERIERVAEEDEAVARAEHFFNTGSGFFISRDGRRTAVAIYYKNRDQEEREEAADRLADKLEDEPTVVFGGQATVNEQLRTQVEEDLRKAEMLGFPLLFIVSLFVFRGVVAALLPLFVGILTIFGTFLALRIVSLFYDVNVFALNIVVGLGLGLAIDYSLFIVSRYREEMARVGQGRAESRAYGALPEVEPGAPGKRFVGSTSEALRRTMLTAGRTIMFSAVTVAVAVSSLIIFPQPFLRSMGIGAVCCSLVAMLIALIALPALLGVLGPRVNALAPARWQRSNERTARQERSGFWYRLSHFVMRHPGAVAGVSACLLIAVGASFLRADFLGVNARIVPPDLSSRQVSDIMSSEFRTDAAAELQLLIEAPPDRARDVERFRQQLAQRSDVAAARYAPPAQPGERPRPLSEKYWELDVQPWQDGLSDTTIELVEDIRAGPQPFPVMVNGEAPSFLDQQETIQSRLPIALAILVLSTIVVLFIMTGSVILPIKSVLMNLLTISFTLGLLVLIFQDGRLEGLLGFESRDALDLAQPILICAVAFGLSTDYAVFLLGRIYEARVNGADDRESVAIGLERTGRIVTQAALLFCLAIGAFATSEVIFIKQVGVGTAAAVLIDSTIIRGLLVPSLMAMLGARNWWAPGPLRRLHNRIGLSEA